MNFSNCKYWIDNDNEIDKLAWGDCREILLIE